VKKGNTVGLDMGDKSHSVCVVNEEGHVLSRTTVANTAVAIRKYFGKMEACRVVMEAGTHSGWVSRILEAQGHEVLVGNPRKLRVIWDSDEKNDERDAEMLARIGRFDPQLLYPIHHRGPAAQADLAVIKARDMLVRVRSTLIAHARGTVKSMGGRISACSAESFPRRLLEEMPAELVPALEPVMKSIEELSSRIRHYDKRLETLCTKKYPETKGLRAIGGVGPVTALAFVLTIEDHSRFEKSRAVGPYFGLAPKRDQSGATDKQLRITKAGDAYVRRLLVGCSQYILGPFGPDCDLKRFGLKLAARGGKNAKRRAVVAVTRKLAVLMHHLWKSGAVYDPFYHHNHKQKKAA
jgi:transposase